MKTRLDPLCSHLSNSSYVFIYPNIDVSRTNYSFFLFLLNFIIRITFHLILFTKTKPPIPSFVNESQVNTLRITISLINTIMTLIDINTIIVNLDRPSKNKID